MNRKYLRGVIYNNTDGEVTVSGDVNGKVEILNIPAGEESTEYLMDVDSVLINGDWKRIRAKRYVFGITDEEEELTPKNLYHAMYNDAVSYLLPAYDYLKGRCCGKSSKD